MVALILILDESFAFSKHASHMLCAFLCFALLFVCTGIASLCRTGNSSKDESNDRQTEAASVDVFSHASPSDIIIDLTPVICFTFLFSFCFSSLVLVKY